MHFPLPARTLGPGAALILAALALSACGSGQMPNTYAAMQQGVGFGDYQRHLREREAQAPQRGIPYSIPPETAAPAPLPPAASLPPSPVAAQPLPPAPVPAPVAQAPLATTALADPGAPRPEGGVSSQTYEPIPFGSRPADAHIPPQGTAEIVHVASVPQGTGSGPNVMAYALQTRHAVGTAQHRRMNPLRWTRWESACLQFPNQDAAQEAFLANGGPERDGGNLDPDGDGFACWWDPAVYRQAASLGQ